jgi:hypothetical protein
MSADGFVDRVATWPLERFARIAKWLMRVWVAS